MTIKTIGFILITVALASGLFYLIKPRNQTVTLPDNSSQIATSTPVSTNKVFEIVVKNKKIISGTETFKVNEGDNVVLKFTADEGGEVHLHGYDKHVDLEKNIEGVEGELSFVANLTGRFEFELEDSKTDLGVLEVMPKQ